MTFDLLNETPKVVYYHNALTEKECDYVIKNADNFEKSLGFDLASKQPKPTEWRTSSNHFDHAGKFKYITEKAAELSNHPVVNIEPPQILKYQIDEFYKPHHDFFNFPPDIITTHNDRVGTVIFYLNDAFLGGATRFPSLNITVRPRKGSALFFEYNYSKDINYLTMHGGMPVIQGTKYIATSWIRGNQWGHTHGS